LIGQNKIESPLRNPSHRISVFQSDVVCQWLA
jgi:hypothetical protein